MNANRLWIPSVKEKECILFIYKHLSVEARFIEESTDYITYQYGKETKINEVSIFIHTHTLYIDFLHHKSIRIQCVNKEADLVVMLHRDICEMVNSFISSSVLVDEGNESIILLGFSESFH